MTNADTTLVTPCPRCPFLLFVLPQASPTGLHGQSSHQHGSTGPDAPSTGTRGWAWYGLGSGVPYRAPALETGLPTASQGPRPRQDPPPPRQATEPPSPKPAPAQPDPSRH